MSIWKCFQMAMSSIVGNKMRSILTMLGIIIGITAVFSLFSLIFVSFTHLTLPTNREGLIFGGAAFFKKKKKDKEWNELRNEYKQL